MSELTIELRGLELKICELITKFENSNDVQVSNIGYTNVSRGRTDESLFDTTYRTVEISVKLP